MNVVSPRTLEAALDALADATPDTCVLAGGTDLMVEFDIGRTRPDRVIDVWRVDELRRIREEQDGVRVGALTTCNELLRSDAVSRAADILVDAVREFGAVQIRNRATIGGNLGTASPAADLTPALFVLGAQVRLCSRRGQRDVPVHEFVTGYRTNACKDDELIESVLLPWRAEDERRAFRKVGTRSAQSIAKLSAAVALTLKDGHITALDAAAGSVAACTVRLDTLRQQLVGAAPQSGLLRAAVAASLQADVSPRTDVRSSAEYRGQVLARILLRMLGELVAEGA